MLTMVLTLDSNSEHVAHGEGYFFYYKQIPQKDQIPQTDQMRYVTLHSLTYF